MIQTRKTRHNARKPTNYSRYTRTSGNTGVTNGRTILAKKIIIQSLACIIIIFFITWLQSQVDETPRNIVTQIRLHVVDSHITPDDIYQSFADTYEDCLEYIQGNN